MDARERLRRYLEQRRDLGESELVLDGMTVEDVLKIVGAKGADAAADSARPPASAPRADEPRRADAPPPADVSPPARAADPVRPQESASAADPGDWRSALRAAGGDPADLRKGAPPTRTPRASRPSEAAADASPRSPSEDAAIARARPAEPRDSAGMEETPIAATNPAPASASNSRDWSIPGIEAPVGIVIERGAGEASAGAIAALESIQAVAASVASCTRCKLYATALNPVPGSGRADADLMCIGEAPGQNEDESGLPFVGAAGQLLTKILAAIKLSRDDVFIANVLKHRPPANRNPLPEEVKACSPYLVRQVELVRPKVIIAFGTFAAQTLLETKTPIGKLRGAVHRYHGIPLIVTYHPAALLRNEAWKRPTWEDVKLARRILDSATAT